METTSSNQAFDIQKIKTQALAVITRPVDFFRGMAKSGGFTEPLVFLVLMSFISGVIRAVFMLTTSVGLAVGQAVIWPIFVAIFGFIAAGILFVIWKLMGSQENYEATYRCMAYAFAITPIIALLSIIPYVGDVAALAWLMYLIYIASLEVHHISQKKAQIVWGIIFVLFALGGISAERNARNMEVTMKEYQTQLEQMDEADMTPEQAGQAFGEFIKGMEKAAQQQATQEQQAVEGE